MKGFQVLALIILLNGCQPHQSQLMTPMSEQTLDIQQIPNETEVIDDEDSTLQYESAVMDFEDLQNPLDSQVASSDIQNPQSQVPIIKPTTPQVVLNPSPTPTPEKSKISKLIEWAHKTMIEEGLKLGTACNRFVLRVLTKLGFPNITFLANDFDVYAKKYIKNYKTHTFKAVDQKSEAQELKKIIWSYPERTPFIAQWKRVNNHGHIAVIEKFQNQIIIYQASLNKHTARRSVTTPDRLLNYNRRAHLILYTELE